jgi:very-short-patch-repair endonuclease
VATRRIVQGARVSSAKPSEARRLRREPTPAERALWQHLRASRLSGLRFRRQQVIRGFIGDFFCSAAELVVEVDGPVHHTEREYDLERDMILGEMGLRVLRFANSAVLKDQLRWQSPF